jgi:hypothetical protein
MSDKVLVWLWLPECTKVKVGQTQTAEGSLELRNNDMHASRHALDALQYAEGTVICQLGLSGEVLAMADAMIVLHEFMCWCAEQALLREREARREPDPKSWTAIETKRKWLKGEANDAELDVASAAARDAAWAAARDAAWAAAVSAAWAAAWSATLGDARDIVWAVWEVAWESAWSAAWNTAWEFAWDTTKVAAKSATRDATWDSQNAKLEEMLNALLKEGEQ